jgi:hypothetical protein
MKVGEAQSLAPCGARTPILTRWSSSLLKSASVPLVLGTDEHVQVLHLDLCQCEPFCVGTRQVYHRTFSGVSPVLLTSRLLMHI